VYSWMSFHNAIATGLIGSCRVGPAEVPYPGRVGAQELGIGFDLRSPAQRMDLGGMAGSKSFWRASSVAGRRYWMRARVSSRRAQRQFSLARASIITFR